MARKPDPEMIDEDAPELTDAELAEMRPAAEVLPPEFYALVTKRPRGRPKSARHQGPGDAAARPRGRRSLQGQRARMADPDERRAQGGRYGPGRNAPAPPGARVVVSRRSGGARGPGA